MDSRLDSSSLIWFWTLEQVADRARVRQQGAELGDGRLIRGDLPSKVNRPTATWWTSSPHGGEFVARGLYNSRSKIRVRLYTWDDAVDIDGDFFGTN